jgi:hypothetical protein
MTETAQISHPRVTKKGWGVARVVDSTIAATTTLQPGNVTVTHMRRVDRGGKKTLAERVREAYKYDLEPEEKELLDHAAEQFGRRLGTQE